MACLQHQNRWWSGCFILHGGGGGVASDPDVSSMFFIYCIFYYLLFHSIGLYGAGLLGVLNYKACTSRYYHQDTPPFNLHHWIMSLFNIRIIITSFYYNLESAYPSSCAAREFWDSFAKFLAYSSSIFILKTKEISKILLDGLKTQDTSGSRNNLGGVLYVIFRFSKSMNTSPHSCYRAHWDSPTPA